MRKRLFIQRLLTKRDVWEMLINQVGAARLSTMPVAGSQRSVKDIIARVMAYEQYLADRLAEIAHGELYYPAITYTELETFQAKFGYPDFGSNLLDENIADNWIFEKYRNVPMEEVVALECNAFHAVITGLEALTEDQITRHNLFQQVHEHASEHFHAHGREIKNWLITVSP